jgi:predicted methyltransferase
MRRVFTILILLFLSAQIIAQELSPIRQKIQDAMASDIRTEEDKARDIYRKPDQVLEFFSLNEDMRVIEILPFGGWYTKILGPILRDNGQLYTTQPNLGRYSDALEPTLAMPGMDRVIKLEYNGRAKNSDDERWIGTDGNWDVEPVDLVLTFQNYHNYDYEDRMALNKTVFNALKPGGTYGIVDHTRRHMEPGVRINRRRFDPVLLIKEVQKFGFEFVDYSDLLAMSDDELILEVGQPQVSGRSDRFTLLFRKPE